MIEVVTWLKPQGVAGLVSVNDNLHGKGKRKGLYEIYYGKERVYLINPPLDLLYEKYKTLSS